nr:arsenate reductase family protein [Brevundimonas terrae]
MGAEPDTCSCHDRRLSRGSDLSQAQGRIAVTVTLYHNPKCSTSRKALELLQEKGIQTNVVEYLKTGWTTDVLDRLAQSTGKGLGGLLRMREDEAKALVADGASDDAIRAAMIANPVLVQRPIIETPKGARVGRPLEDILDVL